MKQYHLLFKTGDAEFRALKHCSNLSHILPIIELTKGLRSKNDAIGNIAKRLASIEEIFNEKEFILDITTDEYQSNAQTIELYNYNDGYANWCNFVINLGNQKAFKKVIPALLININDLDFDNNLARQTRILSSQFKQVVYRTPITEPGYEDDLIVINSSITKGCSLKVIIDCGDLQTIPSEDLENNIDLRISNILNIVKGTPIEIVLAGTSFSNSVPSVSKEDSGNSLVIHFEKKKRDKNKDYADAYSIVPDSILRLKEFPSYLKNNWGISQIIKCANNEAPGANPSFWISVRMSIYIDQILRILPKLDNNFVF